MTAASPELHWDKMTHEPEPISTLKADRNLPHQCLLPKNHSSQVLVDLISPQSSCSTGHVCQRVPKLAHEDVRGQEESPHL